jgi:hypothetical protein
MALTLAGAHATRAEESPAVLRILDLPSELVSNVCEYVDRRDLLQIHLSCRGLKVHSITSFGSYYFNRLVVILHPLSLGILF